MVIEFVRDAAAREDGVVKVRFFGSRARGDHHIRSDYDFAVEAPGWTAVDWGRWSEDLRENVPTLAGLDLIWLSSETPSSLVDAIARDGRTIFERGKKN